MGICSFCSRELAEICWEIEILIDIKQFPKYSKLMGWILLETPYQINVSIFCCWNFRTNKVKLSILASVTKMGESLICQIQ